MTECSLAKIPPQKCKVGGADGEEKEDHESVAHRAVEMQMQGANLHPVLQDTAAAEGGEGEVDRSKLQPADGDSNSSTAGNRR